MVCYNNKYMAISKKNKSAIEEMALRIVDEERSNWEDAICYVTEDVGFKMRAMIRTFRKNYWGVFDSPTDPNTGLDKFWFHLAMKTVEDIVKNIDIDSKDVNYRAKNPDGQEITEVVRAWVKEWLDKNYFGETLDETERQACIDGTVVWKTWLNGKKIERRTVDLLHVYINPVEDNIQSAYRFTERGIMTPSQIAGMTGWMNTGEIKGSQGLDFNDSERMSANAMPTTGSFADVWEMWGKIPESLITGKAKDTKEIDGHIIVSGLESGDRRVHLIEKNNNQDVDGNIIKPYEELRLVKVSGRWYGLGFIERLLALQEYLNATMNMRINKARVSQLGLFKIRKGAGITPQMLANLPSNGVVSLTNMADLEPMMIPPVDGSSYKDEEVIKEWASGVTQAYPASTGEETPASKSATAVAVESSGSKSAYVMSKNAINSFIERWSDRQLLPKLAKVMPKDELLRIMSDDGKFKEITERVVKYYAHENMKEGKFPNSEQEMMVAIDNAREALLKKDGLFFKLVQDIVAKNIDTKVYATNESMNPGVVIANLLQTLQIAPEYKEPIVKEVFNLMGINIPNLPKIQPNPEENISQAPMAMPTEQGVLQDSLT